MFWIAVVLEDKEMTQTQFFNWLVEVFFDSVHQSASHKITAKGNRNSYSIHKLSPGCPYHTSI